MPFTPSGVLGDSASALGNLGAGDKAGIFFNALTRSPSVTPTPQTTETALKIVPRLGLPVQSVPQTQRPRLGRSLSVATTVPVSTLGPGQRVVTRTEFTSGVPSTLIALVAFGKGRLVATNVAVGVPALVATLTSMLGAIGNNLGSFGLGLLPPTRATQGGVTGLIVQARSATATPTPSTLITIALQRLKRAGTVLPTPSSLVTLFKTHPVLLSISTFPATFATRSNLSVGIPAPTLVGTNQRLNSSSIFISLTPASGIPSGVTIFVVVQAATSTTTGWSCTDGVGNFYTLDFIQTGGGQTLAIFSCLLSTAVPPGIAIVVSTPSTAFSSILACYTTGVASASAFDASHGGVGTSPTPASGSSSATAQANEIALGVIAYSTGNTTSPTPFSGVSAGYGQISEVHGNAGGTTAGLVAYSKTLAATGAQAFGLTLNTSETWVAAVVTYTSSQRALTRSGLSATLAQTVTALQLGTIRSAAASGTLSAVLAAGARIQGRAIVAVPSSTMTVTGIRGTAPVRAVATLVATVASVLGATHAPRAATTFASASSLVTTRLLGLLRAVTNGPTSAGTVATSSRGQPRAPQTLVDPLTTSGTRRGSPGAASAFTSPLTTIVRIYFAVAVPFSNTSPITSAARAATNALALTTTIIVETTVAANTATLRAFALTSVLTSTLITAIARTFARTPVSQVIIQILPTLHTSRLQRAAASTLTHLHSAVSLRTSIRLPVVTQIVQTVLTRLVPYIRTGLLTQPQSTLLIRNRLFTALRLILTVDAPTTTIIRTRSVLISVTTVAGVNHTIARLVGALRLVTTQPLVLISGAHIAKLARAAHTTAAPSNQTAVLLIKAIRSLVTAVGTGVSILRFIPFVRTSPAQPTVQTTATRQIAGQTRLNATSNAFTTISTAIRAARGLHTNTASLLSIKRAYTLVRSLTLATIPATLLRFIRPTPPQIGAAVLIINNYGATRLLVPSAGGGSAMAQAFTLRAGDRQKPFVAYCYDQNGPVSLNNAIGALFIMSISTSRAPVIKAAAVITNPITAEVTYNWADGDTDVPNTYFAEIKILWNDGTTQTFPNSGALPIIITPDFAG